MNWLIYTLKNPRTGEVRYVGWTSQSAAVRLNTHIQEAVRKRERNRRTNWILSLLSIGLKPLLEVVESGSGEGWPEVEKRWIAKFRAQGCRLVNATDGGEGAPGHKVSAEQRAAMKRGHAAWLASLPAEKLSSRMKAMNKARLNKMTPAERTAHARLMQAKTTPEQRSARSIKSNATRLANMTPAQRAAQGRRLLDSLAAWRAKGGR